MRTRNFGWLEANGLAPAAILSLALLLPAHAPAQDRLKTMPGYGRFQEISKEIGSAVKLGNLSVTWKDGGKAFEYTKDGKRYRYEIDARIAVPLPEATPEQPERGMASGRKRQARQTAPRPARARQFTSALSPDGKWKAFCRDRNVWLCDSNGSNEMAVTTEGSDSTRVKCGSASWVYGEELDQNTAMWWSPNSRKLAFYRFDESQVIDYYLTLGQTNIQSTLYVEPYNKAGATNPVVDVLIYDVDSRQTVRADVRSGKPCEDAVPGHYVYGVAWSPDGSELLFHRTDRKQKVMELCAADPDSGKCRAILREEWPASWVENSPEMRFLQDGKRFIWSSERTGWKNYYLYSLTGELLARLTQHNFEVAGVIQVEERGAEGCAPCLYYMARSGDNPMKLQLHRVGLDGNGDQRLTEPAFHHSVDVAPDGRHFIDTLQTHDRPPATQLCDAGGAVVAELSTSEMTRFSKLGLKPVELFTFKAADGRTDLFGMLHFPSQFQPKKKYPLLVSVYAGPATTGASERFTLPNTLTEFGFLVASFDSRSADGRGKRSLDAIYQNLGVVEIDDQAAGVKFLAERRYVDTQRVGIFGTSYGGTASLLCLLRHPQVFHAACSSSPVTDFRNYDTIYTERYLGLPQENPEAYDGVSSVRHAASLRGRLMLYYGTADDNVHPSNALQLVRALQRAGKSFELQVGPDAGHGSLNRDRMMEFFIENLTLRAQ
jgi:dipeptidyl-peptidase 4